MNNKPSPHVLANIRELWETRPDLTAEKIGKQFGLSRNSILGYAYRLRWNQRILTILSTLDERMDKLTFPPAANCVFPVGDPGTEDFHFCAAVKQNRFVPYCDEHFKMTHISASVLKVETR